MSHAARVPFLTLAVTLAAAVLSIHLFAADDVILRASDATVVRGAWTRVSDATAANGVRLETADLGQPRADAPSPNPASYFELTFSAQAGVPYHLWVRGKAAGDNYANDSVWVQFSDALSAEGAPAWRIGSSTATSIVLEDCPGCGLSGWGWQDNLYVGLAEPIYFESSGTHTIRLQLREDGLAIDQVVLSPATYLNSPPGSMTNDATILGAGTPPPPPPVADEGLVRSPYLQQVTSGSAVIVWASTSPGPAWAEVGAQAFPATTNYYPSSVTGLADAFQHEAVISGLQPGTSYPYRLFVGGRAVTNGSDSLRTAPETGTGRVSFLIFGDSGTGSAEQRALAAAMNLDAADLALHAGDLAYGSIDGTGGASYATTQWWFFDTYAPWLRRRPFFPSMGNHDSRPANSWGEPYLNLFSLPPMGGAGPFPDHAERYYSFDYGPVHFVALDTELAFQDPARRSAQLAWLEADLGATAQPWKVAYFHRSPYSAGGEHGSDLAVRAAFAPIFERYGVQLSLSSHEHVYERTVPLRSSVNSQAVTYVVSGGGGGPLYAAGQDAWTAASASEHHYLRVTIDGCVATLEAVRPSGTLLDAATLDRCAQASDSAAPWVTFSNIGPGSSVSAVATIDVLAADDVRVEKVDLWVDGRLISIDRTAPYSFTWDTASAGGGAHTLEARAYDIAGNRTTSSIVVNVVPGSPGGLADGWLSQDTGAVAIGGSASLSDGRFDISGSGADIWGTTDAFRYTYRRMTGDGAIVARIGAFNGSDPWAKVGVMIRASLDPSSAHAFALASSGNGLAFQRRTAAGAASTHTGGPFAGAPMWVRLSRTGSVVTADTSFDGLNWTTIGADVIALPSDVLVGVAVTSHSNSTLAFASVDNVSVTQPSSLPAGWQARDIGATGLAGHTTGSNGTFTVTGAGADIWGTADGFQFVSQMLDADGDVVARVVSVSGSQPWTKAGVMFRSTTDPASAHAFMLISLGKAAAFQRRPNPGGLTIHTAADGTAPSWVKLARRGTLVIASISSDGATWTVVGTETLPAGSVLAGLAVTSHDATQLATATFDNVTVVSR